MIEKKAFFGLCFSQIKEDNCEIVLLNQSTKLKRSSNNEKNGVYFLVKANNQNDFSRLGYSKLSGVDIDYDYSLLTVDGKTTVGALWRGAINNSNYGWLLDVTSNSDVDTVSAGISVIF